MANVQKDACFGLSLTRCTIFKICSQFLKIAIFSENRKNSFSSKVSVFLMFSVVHLAVHTQFTRTNELVENLVYDKKFSKTMRFYVFAPKP